MESRIEGIRAAYAAELGDLIAEVAAGRGVLAHTNFLKAVVSSPTPLTLEEIAALTRENAKNTQSRIQVFQKSNWLTSGKRGDQNVFYFDMPAFLPDRTDRLFDAPGRITEYQALVAQIEAAAAAASGAVKEELEAMKRTLAGVIPPLAARAKDIGL